MTDFAAVIAVALAAFAVCGWATLRLARSPGRFARLLDQPNERSLHRMPVPRTGGIAVLAGLVTAIATAAVVAGGLDPVWAWVAGALLVVAVVSFLDDRGGVAAGARLALHLAAAALLLAGGLTWPALELPGLVWPLPPAAGTVAAVLFVVWMINLYNFMDGMDGLAAGMAVFGFASLAWLGWQGGDLQFALLNVAVASAAGGFLLGNFPPARIFLGDVGSASLGLLAAASSLAGSARDLFPLWVAWLAFSPFIVDATWTLLRRLIRRERVWEAHRSHHYQRLVLAGWGHRRTVLRAYLLMVACAATAVAATAMTPRDQWLLLGGWVAIYLFIGLKTRLIERDGQEAPT